MKGGNGRATKTQNKNITTCVRERNANKKKTRLSTRKPGINYIHHCR